MGHDLGPQWFSFRDSGAESGDASAFLFCWLRGSVIAMRPIRLLPVLAAFPAIFACGATQSTVAPADASAPDTSVFDASLAAPDASDAAPACASGGPCATNAGAPCLTGVIACSGGQAQCVDGAPAADGLACKTGLCTRGACLAPLSVTTTVDLSKDPVTPTRTCAESPVFSVIGLTSTTATLSASPAAACLTKGDEVILINLQGAPGQTPNIGVWELLEVAGVSAGVVSFTTNKAHSYGATTNTDASIGIVTLFCAKSTLKKV